MWPGIELPGFEKMMHLPKNKGSQLNWPELGGVTVGVIVLSTTNLRMHGGHFISECDVPTM